MGDYKRFSEQDRGIRVKDQNSPKGRPMVRKRLGNSGMGGRDTHGGAKWGFVEV